GDMPEVSVGAAAAERLSRGIADAAPAAEAPVYWASHRGAPIAVLERGGAGVRIKRVFRIPPAPGA
ncbi:MAG: hypothetical protein AAGF90_19930, partial [Pseudomonadota bacterium]